MHVIKKVPLEELLDVLNDLYEKGVDYVDLITKEDENRISLIFTEEYWHLKHVRNSKKEPRTKSS